MKKLLMVLFIFAVMAACDDVADEKFCLSTEQIMVVYQSGYVAGALNAIQHNYDKNVWRSDSLDMAKIWTD